MTQPYGRWDTMRALSRAQPPSVGEGALLQVAGANLSMDFTTTALVPTYTTLLTAAFTSVASASFLGIVFYASCDFTGPPGGTFRQINVRFRLNGTLIAVSRACSKNSFTNGNTGLHFSRRIAITAGLQTVVAEVALAPGTGTGTMHIDAASDPDAHGAHLFIRETN